MPKQKTTDAIPVDLTRDDVLQAIIDFEKGINHPFAPSTKFDLVYEGKRYPPKAITGLASRRILNRIPGPNEFRGGQRSRCYRLLRKLGFSVLSKLNIITLTTEIDLDVSYFEGSVKQVVVNRYERDRDARLKCIEHYGNTYRCEICHFNFVDFYGEIGKEFIHVHHLRELSSIGEEYQVNPEEDLIPVCPNCHAMLHRERPAIDIDRLREIIHSMKLSSSS